MWTDKRPLSLKKYQIRTVSSAGVAIFFVTQPIFVPMAAFLIFINVLFAIMWTAVFVSNFIVFQYIKNNKG